LAKAIPIVTKQRPLKSADRTRALQHLHELIAALDRRLPHVERAGEVAIAAEAALLRKKAQERILELEREDSAGPA